MADYLETRYIKKETLIKTRNIKVPLPLAAIIIIASLSICFTVQAQETVIWYQADFPPYIIIKGASKKYGVQSRINDYLISKLPMYKHTQTTANYGRILHELENKRPGVASPVLKTSDREKFLLYSKSPCFILLSNGLAVKRSNMKKFKPFILNDGMLDLEALCKSQSVSIGIAKGRVYKGILDEMIGKYKDTGIFNIRHGTDHYGMLKMLANNRIDAAFIYPIEVKYAGFESEIEVLRISRMKPYAPSYIAVPKNKWGQILIDRIDRIMKEKGVKTMFYSYYEYWLSETDKTYYRKHLKDFNAM